MKILFLDIYKETLLILWVNVKLTKTAKATIIKPKKLEALLTTTPQEEKKTARISIKKSVLFLE